MNQSSLRILKAVAKNGELSLDDAIALSSRAHNDHRDQYPLAMLIEEEYLGITISHEPPVGAEKMREFSLAITLHMETLRNTADGSVEYRGVRSTGLINADWRRVFLKAKGSLYLADRGEKRTERLFTIFIAVLSAFLAAWITL
jgi:hypothetical protein